MEISDSFRPVCQIMLHKIGQACESDVCLLEEQDDRFYAHAGRTKDFEYLTLNTNSKTASEVPL
jgi:protease II